MYYIRYTPGSLFIYNTSQKLMVHSGDGINKDPAEAQLRNKILSSGALFSMSEAWVKVLEPMLCIQEAWVQYLASHGSPKYWEQPLSTELGVASGFFNFRNPDSQRGNPFTRGLSNRSIAL